MLKIGQIEYANCTPLFHALREYYPCSEYEFVSGVPAELNRKLLAGEIDVCPSSSIEYANHPDRYSILPQLSISSIGAVASVLLFSKVSIEALDGCKITLSSESATSVNLLKIILSEKYGLSCIYNVAKPGEIIVADDGIDAFLLIGDAALRASLKKNNMFVYDLGDLWYKWTGYPFVFALWLCQNEIAESTDLRTLAMELLHAKKLAPEQLEHIASNVKEASWLGRDRLLKYWRENISYNLDQQAQEGLILYYRKCFEIGLITAVPELCFVEPEKNKMIL